MSTRYTKSPTIRISDKTKRDLENLDFVRKHTFDEILGELVKFYIDKNEQSRRNF